METVGDKYMLASGLPEKSTVHAKNIALVALDMLDIVREIAVDDHPVRVSYIQGDTAKFCDYPVNDYTAWISGVFYITQNTTL